MTFSAAAESRERNCRGSKRHERVLFLIPPTGHYCREDRCQSFFRFHLIPSLRQPIEECEASAGVRWAGGEPTIIDAPAAGMNAAEVFDQVDRIDPDLTVISTTFGTLEADLAWAARLKMRHRNTPVGLRGAPCYVQAEEILSRSADIDFCVQGDYEIIFRDVVLAGHQNAAGVSYREAGKVIHARHTAFAEDLDQLPFADRSAIDGALYRVRFFGKQQATIHVQRGCPFECSYCLAPVVSGQRVRRRSPSSIVDEIIQIREKKVRFFFFRAETFTIEREWTLELCQLLQERCPGVLWVTTTRADMVDHELLAAMSSAGCYGLSFGVETGSAEIGERIHKPVKPQQTLRAMRLCDEHHVISLVYVLLGFLWDTNATIAETKKFLRTIRPDFVTVYFSYPYPGTNYHQEVVQANRAVLSLRAQADPAVALTSLSASDLRRHATAILLQNAFHPLAVFSRLRKLLRRALVRSFLFPV